MSVFDSLSRLFFPPQKRGKYLELRSQGNEIVSATSLSRTETLEPKRVSPKDLELVYMREGIVYKWVNLFSESVLASNFRIEASNERDRKIVADFLDSVSFRSLFRRTIRHLLIYGNAFWEIIWNDSKTKIVSVSWLDPKMMDVLRTPMGTVDYDNDGKPKGYVQYLPFNVDISKVPQERRVSQIPKFQDYQTGHGIKYERDEIIHFTFNEIGSSFWGIGIIEPIYNLILVKQNVEQGYAEAVQRTAFPRIWVQVGDEHFRPTQEQIDDVWRNLSNLEAKHQFVGPYYYKPTILETKRSDKITVNLEYFIDQIVAGLGGPKPFITGSGEDTNRATLSDQKLFFERSIKEIQEEMAEIIRNELFTKIAAQYKMSSVPRMIWDEISTESLDSKAERLLIYSKAGLLDPDEKLKKTIRKIERLPLDEGEEK